MSREHYKIFSEGTIGNMTVRNRLVRSATVDALSQRHVPDDLESLYDELARGGTGLIITGAIGAIPESGLDGAYSRGDLLIPGISKIANVVHEASPNCRIAVEIAGQTGRRREAYGASDLSTPALKMRGLSTPEIRKAIDFHVETAINLKEAGFDAIQLHAAHGKTLLWTFLSPYANHRSDEYGGSAKNRARIIREFVSETRAKIGDFPLLIKMNCEDNLEGGINFENFPELAYEIGESGIDAIEISGGSDDSLVRSEEELGFPPLPVPDARTRINTRDKQSYFVKYAESIDLDIPVILVGGHRDVERIEQIVQDGTADFIALCRPLISEPDLPNRWKEGRGSNTTDCISCNSCVYAAFVHPGREERMPFCIVKNAKRENKAAQEWLRSRVEQLKQG